MTRSKVEPERGGESTKMAGGFCTAAAGAAGSAGINRLNSAIWALPMRVARAAGTREKPQMRLTASG